MEHTPFRVLLKSCTPAVITAFAPTLDGLLFQALSMRWSSLPHEDLLSKLKEVLTFNDQYGVYHASSLIFGVTPDHGLVGKSYIRVDYQHPAKLSSNMFSPEISRGKFKPILLSGGPTKRRVSERCAYSAPYFSFDALGNPHLVEEYLGFYMLGVGYDCQNSGMGAYSDVMTIPLETDVSLVNNGHAMRPLPKEAAAEGLPSHMRLLPPYYQGDFFYSVSPENIRIKPVSKLISGE